MNNEKVIDLQETRELLAEWNEVKVAILAGLVAGFHAGGRGAEKVYLGGVYREDPMQAVRGLLRAAAAAPGRTEVPRLAFRSSQM